MSKRINKQRTKTEWSANDYQRAARKHHLVCSNLISLLEKANPKAKTAICHDIYYLSGYVIECSLKAVFLKRINDDATKCFSKEELKDMGLITHNLQTLLQKYADINGIASVEFSQSSHLMTWTEEIRYHNTPSQNESIIKDISEFVKGTVTKIYTITSQNY